MVYTVKFGKIGHLCQEVLYFNHQSLSLDHKAEIKALVSSRNRYQSILAFDWLELEYIYTVLRLALLI